ncbi:hypothetical protein N7468_009581 [Penicillium chermesinum]|uniref:Uncharacterized protein n=1 Tax=Penicillium chermesinum TaxID=63820 RepID=A0A9W9NI40_9EURO|nr:uncharacterized protein N7468_009581 [Penicillium chermesinum]KAJ5220377.1 hypothetical protein N7468_009581 [Penicillium chermesinum]
MRPSVAEYSGVSVLFAPRSISPHQQREFIGGAATYHNLMAGLYQRQLPRKATHDKFAALPEPRHRCLTGSLLYL